MITESAQDQLIPQVGQKSFLQACFQKSLCENLRLVSQQKYLRVIETCNITLETCLAE
ncbi:17424_t:CDS:2, partial [Cetraspora pellucida]